MQILIFLLLLAIGLVGSVAVLSKKEEIRLVAVSIAVCLAMLVPILLIM